MAESNAKANIEWFREMQRKPYGWKVQHAAEVARTFFSQARDKGMNCHVSVGGLDSITLHYFLESIGICVPCVSCSSLEQKGVRAVHKRIADEMREEYANWEHDHGALCQSEIDKIEDQEEKVREQAILDAVPNKPEFVFLKPLKPKTQVIQEFGWPVLSKEIAGKISLLQNPTEKNRTVRHAIITGETGEYGGFQKNSRMKMSQKWLDKFGGADEEGAALGYGKASFKVSDRCCYYLKERPNEIWAKEHNSVPYVGLMASEGGRREKALMMHLCNYWGKSTARSAPFAIFSRQDILQLALDLQVPVPEEYGEIVRNTDGTLHTTLAQRTGCEMCGFGIHLEKRPHRFDRLRESNPVAWEFWMKNAATDENGQKYGWGRVLDYIGIAWENEPGQLNGQTRLY
nr:MAG TPA: phosphoadenosine-phosphosulfate reductase [Caudoviricetes sp.]